MTLQAYSGFNANVKKHFRNFDEASSAILGLMSRFIGINTLFIAKNDKSTNNILKVIINKKNLLLEAGSSLPFEETFCKLSVDNGREPLIIPDLTRSELTRDLGVTMNLGGGSFIGSPIYYEDGENYGTICGLDSRSYTFTEEHRELFYQMASLLSYVLELDKAHKQIENLSAPIVPLTNGIAILPIIGDIGEARANSIIAAALQFTQQEDLEFLLIDLSGISKIDEMIQSYLLSLVKMLRLVGVEPILTGFRPEMAIKTVQLDAEMGDVKIFSNLKQALDRIGITFKAK
ncbi:rsbT co-antagonist protein RsbR [Bacillus sp. OV322]|uniref:STAS domain-containing protein n=1 Tax=Bacillus sp. OV322 TaxID=1882764 RepID=UPI0008F3A825|nr:STAS domain-containing protein [Bacillus sp. OV322]SFC81320.1 rsbT co-antagonist protein RsbR [Bacillus sp. OV322]